MKKIIAALLVTLTVNCALPAFIHAEESKKEELDLNYLKKVVDSIKEKYKYTVTDKELMEGALKGLFGSMDKYTVFYNNEESKGFLGTLKGSFKGIGVTISQIGTNIIITSVFEGSPAKTAGLLEGDIIEEIDGKSIVGKSTDDVVELIKGEDGTIVTLGIIRNGDTKITKVEVKRGEIRVNPVSYWTDKDIGYIKLDMFNSNSSQAMIEALKYMDTNGIRKIILDLRDNPGGEVSQVVSIAENFVPKGLITKLDYKSEEEKDESYYSKLEKVKYKLAVLVNENSASASEILAGAIQDMKSGTLIGTTTYGKGRVQNIFPVLSPEAVKKYEEKYGSKTIDAYELQTKYNAEPLKSEIIGYSKITTGEYFTPNGRMIDGKGLEPDYKIENPKELPLRVGAVKKLRASTRYGMGSKSEEVYNAERVLMLCGYDVNTPDLDLDNKTFEAIKKFQNDNGMFPYGVLDLSTQKKLNEKLAGLVLEKDKQFAKALEVLKD